jgi:predicted trehalose synthase
MNKLHLNPHIPADINMVDKDKGAKKRLVMEEVHGDNHKGQLLLTDGNLVANKLLTDVVVEGELNDTDSVDSHGNI